MTLTDGQSGRFPAPLESGASTRNFGDRRSIKPRHWLEVLAFACRQTTPGPLPASRTNGSGCNIHGSKLSPVRMIGQRVVGCFSYRLLGNTTNAMPPIIAADAASKRSVNGSPKKNTPPDAAMTGTLSCTVAAVVDCRNGSAVYQMAYPTPEANAPDSNAYPMPAGSNEARSNSSTLKTIAKGAARKKLPAVTLSGSPPPLPRRE